ncbi:hypothetical protein K438DRAFT_1809710 [Mycena galopus ATCC 62051]|nr:hypothetical protein K438DRAFT_1809710 [Mycena galopus ATCC 62051]
MVSGSSQAHSQSLSPPSSDSLSFLSSRLPFTTAVPVSEDTTVTVQRRASELSLCSLQQMLPGLQLPPLPLVLSSWMVRLVGSTLRERKERWTKMPQRSQYPQLQERKNERATLLPSKARLHPPRSPPPTKNPSAAPATSTIPPDNASGTPKARETVAEPVKQRSKIGRLSPKMWTHPFPRPSPRSQGHRVGKVRLVPALLSLPV